MKFTGIVRNPDELGRFVIPKEMRENMNITKYTPIELYVEDKKIILEIHEVNCVFCGSTENLTIFKERPICASCVEELK